MLQRHLCNIGMAAINFYLNLGSLIFNWEILPMAENLSQHSLNLVKNESMNVTRVQR